MRNLLRASYYRYFSSPLTRIAALVVLILGLLEGWKASDPMSLNDYIMLDDMDFILSIVAGAIVISLIAGREFSDRTIRNKLTCGLKKTQIFLSECITGCTVMTVFFLLTVIPLICFTIGGLKLLPAGTPVLLFVILWLVYLAGAVITVTCCFLSTNRTYGVLIAGGVLFLLCLSGYMIHRRLLIGEEEYMISYEYVYGSEGGEPTEVEHKEPNPDYLPESKRDLIRYVSAVDPGFAMQEAVRYTYYANDVVTEKLYPENADEDSRNIWEHSIEEKRKEKQKDTDLLPFLILGQCGFIVLLTGCGVFIFRRKNLA